MSFKYIIFFFTFFQTIIHCSIKEYFKIYDKKNENFLREKRNDLSNALNNNHTSQNNEELIPSATDLFNYINQGNILTKKPKVNLKKKNGK